MSRGHARSVRSLDDSPMATARAPMTPGTDRAELALAEIEQLVRAGGRWVEARAVADAVLDDGRRLPVWAIVLGSPDPARPGIGIFGGVHGLEHIGTEVAIACLGSVVQRLQWDASLHHLLGLARLVFMPLVNPGGLALGTRANPQGVDLMRNAPVDCLDGAPPLLGGQRLSAKLPWYRGPAGAPMQPEAQALCDVVQRELMPRPFALAVDCHSGFGLHDRIWLPHAHTRAPLPQLAEALALAELMDANLLRHRYLIEPQSHQYLAHGDLWDHLVLRDGPAAADGSRVLLPLTLEMGSWLWIKKNPRQLFSRHGLFNPLIAHRQHRVLRRHLGLLDFLLRAAASHRAWQPHGDARAAAAARGRARWYGPGIR